MGPGPGLEEHRLRGWLNRMPSTPGLFPSLGGAEELVWGEEGRAVEVQKGPHGGLHGVLSGREAPGQAYGLNHFPEHGFRPQHP